MVYLELFEGAMVATSDVEMHRLAFWVSMALHWDFSLSRDQSTFNLVKLQVYL